MVKRYENKLRKWNIRNSRFTLPLLLIIIGVGVISYVIAPIAFFQLTNAAKLTNGGVVSPIPEILSTLTTDYTKASNWFPTATHNNPATPSLVSSYWLSIPKLNIDSALVSTTNDDLFKNLVHYSGSSLPGEFGNAVIFGHSTLPQLFNPKNYKTIFSTLHTLKVGDELVIDVDGVTYKYSIFEIKVIDPQDISVLEQKYDNSYVTVITCTPPGTYWKRLVIRGKVEDQHS